MVLVAVAAGVSAALLSLPAIGPVLTVGSVLYIVYLAWRIATAPPLAEIDPAIAPPPLWGGVALGVANPKAYVAIGAVFAANRLTIDPATDALAKTAILAVIIVVIHVAWLFAGRAFAHVLRDPRASRIANAALAALLVLTSLLALLPRHG